MFDALCEVRNIYQRNVVEIGVDVEQREEVEIPVEMVRHVQSFWNKAVENNDGSWEARVCKRVFSTVMSRSNEDESS